MTNQIIQDLQVLPLTTILKNFGTQALDKTIEDVLPEISILSEKFEKSELAGVIKWVYGPGMLEILKIKGYQFE
jgi:hypothetical protein